MPKPDTQKSTNSSAGTSAAVVVACPVSQFESQPAQAPTGPAVESVHISEDEFADELDPALRFLDEPGGLELANNSQALEFGDNSQEFPLAAILTVNVDVQRVSSAAHVRAKHESLALQPAAKRFGYKRFWFVAAPSWLVSLLVHVAIIVLLAAVHTEPVQRVLSVLTAERGDSATEGLQEFDISAGEIAPPAMSEVLAPPTSVSSPADVIPQMPELQISEFGNLQVDTSVKNLVEQIVPSSSLTSNEAAQLFSSLSSRSSNVKGRMLERFGGNAASEKAVAMGLKWLAEHQARNGGWTFAHSLVCRGQCKDDGRYLTATNAATAMALLPFLGAGQTHLEGEYQQTVRRGLEFLIRKMKVSSGAHPMGSWLEDGGTMYSHGLAAITVCEAYAMTLDPDLLQPAQLSLNFIVDAQDPRGGGWRYAPKQPGDTSVVGWQLMALKSGAMGNLVVPQRTFRLANSFLESVSMNQGAFFGYDRPTAKIEGRLATTSVGLLCRMYLGVGKDDPGIVEGVKFMSARGPNLSDLYYTYYATQVLRHYGGAEWDRWNVKLRDDLIKAQVTQGHAAGSWLTHVSGRGGHQDKGGRLYCTSLATMILEVYYRHMPLYSNKSSADDFEL